MKKMMKAAIGFAALASLVAGGPVPAIADDHHGGHQDEHHQEHQDVHRVQAHRHWHKGGGSSTRIGIALSASIIASTTCMNPRRATNGVRSAPTSSLPPWRPA